MITGGDLRQSRLDVGYKTFTISPWVLLPVYLKLIAGKNINSDVDCNPTAIQVIIHQHRLRCAPVNHFVAIGLC